MQNKRKGKLELDWVDKGDIILTKFNEEGKTYPASYFQGQVTEEEIMPRELELIESVGEPGANNMLIWGENLVALRSLEREFAGTIKLIYIDPPFNTGQDFEDYEDGLEHSIWLSMMENRLELANCLLSDDGFIFVHIDDNNQAYVRILLDKIFKPTNFRNNIITKRIKKNIREREMVKSVNTGHDFILLYSKNPEALINHPTIKIKRTERWHSFEAAGFRTGMDYELFGHKPRSGNHWRWSHERAKKAIKNGVLRKNPRTGKPEYFIPATEESLTDTIWTDINAYSFRWGFQTEKNEELLKRIIETATKRNDWVLDFFAGSGTTGATAHKMGRNWIMIEVKEDTIKKKAFKRMKKVIKGDPTGISNEVDWEGGGGFKFYKLGDSLIVKHKDYSSIKIINPKYYNAALIEVICNLEGFKLKKNDKLLHGFNKLGNKYAHITEQYVSQGYVDILKGKITDNEELIIYCFNYDEKINLPFNIIIKKLPSDLGKAYQMRLRL
jgi:adenine-specific DNA-methyltransferase